MPDTNTRNTDLLRIEETAELLRIRPSTVRAWILRRKVPFCKIGRLVRIRRADVEAIIAASLVPARLQSVGTVRNEVQEQEPKA